MAMGRPNFGKEIAMPPGKKPKKKGKKTKKPMPFKKGGRVKGC